MRSSKCGVKTGEPVPDLVAPEDFQKSSYTTTMRESAEFSQNRWIAVMKACRSSSSLTWIRPCGPSTQRSRATRGPTSSRDTGWKECNARRRWLNPSRKLQKSSFGRSGVQARIAVASANSQEKVCAALLQHMGFLQDPGEAGGIERALLAIAPGSKTGHFQRIAKASGVDFSEMLFFDDRAMNVRAAEKLGIVAQQVSSLDGLTWAQFHAGLRAWRSQRRSSRVLAQWMKAPKGPGPGPPPASGLGDQLIDLVDEDPSEAAKEPADPEGPEVIDLCE
ncbi:unnamed protein product [Durusdinium trenchii]|uniref:Uncharacterized protein n=4 Tax=Durusdinium trenchii TaxID=1381693 RepID=A0ABP0NR08_9DINO